MLRRILSLAIAFIMLFAVTVSVCGTNSGSLSIGKGGNFVEIPMTGTIGAEITLGSGSVNKDMAAAEHMTAASKLKGKVIASVNGALFNAYYDAKTILSFPSNCARTYGVIIQNGQSVKGAGTAPLLAFTSDGKALIDRVKVNVSITLRRKDTVGIWGVNDYYTDAASVVLITPECGYSVALQTGAVVVHIKNAAVVSVEENAASAFCAAGEKLVIYNSGAWANSLKYSIQPKIGNSAEITTTLTPDRTENQADWNKVVTAVGVNPWLLQGGKDVFDQNGTMEAKMAKDYTAQRTFAAVKADGTLLIGETSGTFASIIAYLQSQGYVDAIALDGGASSMLNAGGTYKQSAGRKLTNVLHIVDYGSASALPKQTANPDIVTPDNWAVGFIDTAYSQGLVPSGFDLAAKQNITRAEFCQLCYKYLETVLDPADLTSRLNSCGISYRDAEASFTDIGNDCHNAIVQAYRLNIVSGKGGGKFDSFASITREEAATMLSKLGDMLGFEYVRESTEFPDAAEFSSYAPGFIDKTYRYGMMDGTNTGFNSKGYFTKEQAITVFVKILP